MNTKTKHWVLQWDDGTYYAKGKCDGFETVESCKSIKSAVKFDSFKDAKLFHDIYGHFYNQDMTAVPIVIEYKVTIGKARKIRARERSLYDE